MKHKFILEMFVWLLYGQIIHNFFLSTNTFSIVFPCLTISPNDLDTSNF